VAPNIFGIITETVSLTYKDVYPFALTEQKAPDSSITGHCRIVGTQYIKVATRHSSGAKASANICISQRTATD
jgi:hypothetical protein